MGATTGLLGLDTEALAIWGVTEVVDAAARLVGVDTAWLLEPLGEIAGRLLVLVFVVSVDSSSSLLPPVGANRAFLKEFTMEPPAFFISVSLYTQKEQSTNYNDLSYTKRHKYTYLEGLFKVLVVGFGDCASPLPPNRELLPVWALGFLADAMGESGATKQQNELCKK
jgi:hypothetical protein